MFLNATLLGAAFLVWFMIRSQKKQRMAVLLAWLIPGAGHLYLGQTKRGLVLGCMVLATFLAGMIIADFRNISPLDRHPVWGVAHLFGGLMSAVAAIATQHLMIVRDNVFYQVGCLYSGVGALLNVLVAIDAFDLASKDARKEETDGGDSPVAAAENEA